MATVAKCISKDGVDKGTVNVVEEPNSIDREDSFYCVGNNDNGVCCGVEVRPVIKDLEGGKGNGFRVRPGFRHIDGCSADKSRTTKIIRHLDVTGNNTQLEKLLSKFNKGKVKRKKRIPPYVVPPTEGGENEMEPRDDDRPIQLEAKEPSNLMEMCALLSRCDTDAEYAGYKVGDVFIDRRSIGKVRESGITEGQIAVVLCSKMSIERINELNFELVKKAGGKYAVVLQDAYSYAQNEPPTFFIVPCTRSAKKKILKQHKRRNDVANVFFHSNKGCICLKKSRGFDFNLRIQDGSKATFKILPICRVKHKSLLLIEIVI